MIRLRMSNILTSIEDEIGRQRESGTPKIVQIASCHHSIDILHAGSVGFATVCCACEGDANMFPNWWSRDQVGDNEGGRLPKLELTVPAGVEKGGKVMLLGGQGQYLTRYLQLLLKWRRKRYFQGLG